MCVGVCVSLRVASTGVIPRVCLRDRCVGGVEGNSSSSSSASATHPGAVCLFDTGCLIPACLNCDITEIYNYGGTLANYLNYLNSDGSRGTV